MLNSVTQAHPESMAGQPCDRRIRLREILNAEIIYRTDTMVVFESGILHNVTDYGALVSTQRPLFEGTQVHLILPSESYRKPISIFITIIRDAGSETDQTYSYGCSVQGYRDPNAYN